MANYSFVIDSSFKPFEMQELLTPYLSYKDTYEKTEAAYESLSDKSDKFKYLSETLPKNSKSRQLYEGYANELSKQAEDLAKNGLNMSNRRALTNLKRRYRGEIGRLEEADTALQEEKKLRRQMATKDSSILYANENLSIDDFLDNSTPNLYSISGDDLYKRGAQAGASASSRMYQDTTVKNLTKYYQEMIQKVGYSPELLEEFRINMSSIPEFQRAVNDILEEKKVNSNLTGVNRQAAEQAVVNGILDGAVYKENSSIHQNHGVLTAAQAAQDARERDRIGITLTTNGLVRDPNSPNGTGFKYVPRLDPKNAITNQFLNFDDEGNIVGVNPDAQLPEGYRLNSVTGKLEKIPGYKSDEDKENAIYGLTGNKLNNLGGGFMYTINNNPRIYKYIGAISSHTGNFLADSSPWQSNHIGKDIPGHMRGATSSILSDSKGDYKVPDKLPDGARVLNATEQNNLMYTTDSQGNEVETSFGKEMNNYLKEKYQKDYGLTDDQLQEAVNNMELVQIPHGNGYEYLIAIKQKQ